MIFIDDNDIHMDIYRSYLKIRMKSMDEIVYRYVYMIFT